MTPPPAAILAAACAALTSAQAPGQAFDLRERLALAPEGATVLVPPGVYAGPLRIDRPLTIVGEPGAVIDGGGNGDIVEIAAPNVTLRALVIRGTGIDLDKENAGIRVLAPGAVIEANTLEDVLFGIDLKAAPGSIVRNNVIGAKALDIARRGDGLRLWRSNGTLIEGNTILDGRDAILWYSDNVTLRRNTCRRSRYGFHFMFSNHCLLEENTLEDNSVGVYLMYSTGVTLRGNLIARNRGPSGYGIGLKETDDFVVEDNAILGNRVGVYIDNSPLSPETEGVFRHNAVAYNDVGFTLLPLVKRNVIVENAFLENIEQLAIAGSGELRGNEFARDGRGNYWSDYGGFDASGDGVGDAEYRAESLFESLMDREPRLRLFLYSPAQQAVELAARALPAVAPRAKFTDPSPLMTPPPTAAPLPPPRPRWPMLAAAASLLCLGAATFAGTRLGAMKPPRPGAAP